MVWKNCTDIRTDHAIEVLGHNSAAIAKIKDKAKKRSSSHCILCKYVLASRKMSTELMIGLKDTKKKKKTI